MSRSYGTTNAAPYAAAPAVGLAGDTYFNTATKLLYLSDGTQWIVASSSGGGGGGGGSTLDGFTRRLNQANDTTYALAAGGNTIPLSTVVDSAGATFTPDGTNTHFTIPSDGLYDLSATAALTSAGAPNSWQINININDIAVARGYPARDVYGGDIIAAQRYLRAGDKVSLYIYPSVAMNIRCISSPNVNDSYTPYLSVWRAGSGIKGDKGDIGATGPDITLQQSSFFYGANNTNGSVLGTDVPTVMPWTQVQNNGFTLANANQRITCTRAGKYEITASLGYYTGTTAAAFSRAQIYQYNSGGTQLALINGLGNGAPANTYCEAVVTGIFDMAVGDYISVFAAIGCATGYWNSNNFVAVVPVGGTKGDPGIAGNLASSYYWWGPTTGGGGITTGAFTQITFTTPYQVAGFHLGTGGGTPVNTPICDVAGKYRCRFSASFDPVAACDLQVRLQQFRAAAIIASSVDQVGTSSAGGLVGLDVEAIFDLQIGDAVAAYVYCSTASNIDSRSYIEITPVGGAKGDPGIAGNLASVNWISAPFGAKTISTTALTVVDTIGTIDAGSVGFTKLSGSRIRCDVAGRYQVQVQYSVLNPSGTPYTEAMIRLYRAAALVGQYESVNSGAVANAWADPETNGVWAMQVNDEIEFVAGTGNPSMSIDTRSWFSITPVGGAKGDTGATGATGPQGLPGTTPAFWFSTFSGPSQLSGAQMQITPADTTSKAGFYRHANGTVVICDQAGWYRIGIHLTEQPGTAVSQYTDVYISIRDGANYANILYQSNPVAMGLTTTVGYYFAADGELIGYMRVGDMVNINVSVDQMKIFYPARSYLSVIPITATGPQGPKGDPGSSPSVAATTWTALTLASGWSNYGNGFNIAKSRMVGDVVELRGLISRSPVTSGSFTIATFPVGQRPIERHLFAAPCGYTMARIDMYADGNLSTIGLQAVGSGDYGYLSLDGIRWSTV